MTNNQGVQVRFIQTACGRILLIILVTGEISSRLYSARLIPDDLTESDPKNPFFVTKNDFLFFVSIGFLKIENDFIQRKNEQLAQKENGRERTREILCERKWVAPCSQGSAERDP